MTNTNRIKDSEQTTKKRRPLLARVLENFSEEIKLPQSSCRTPDKILHPGQARPDSWCTLPFPAKSRIRNKI